jgi:hypothetical protein
MRKSRTLREKWRALWCLLMHKKERSLWRPTGFGDWLCVVECRHCPAKWMEFKK